MSRIVSRWASLIGPETYSKSTPENPVFDPQNPVFDLENRAPDGTEDKSKMAENCHFREIRVTSWCQVGRAERASKPAETLGGDKVTSPTQLLYRKISVFYNKKPAHACHLVTPARTLPFLPERQKPVVTNTSLTRSGKENGSFWAPLPDVLKAAANTAQFRMAGGDVVASGLDELPGDMRERLDGALTDGSLWEHLGGTRMDEEAVAFLDKLGVEAVLVDEAGAVSAAISHRRLQ